jgi:hypothetical protein
VVRSGELYSVNGMQGWEIGLETLVVSAIYWGVVICIFANIGVEDVRHSVGSDRIEDVGEVGVRSKQTK